MRSVIDPALISFTNEAESAARALAWVEAGFKESFRQTRELEVAVAAQVRSTEPVRQLQKEFFRQMESIRHVQREFDRQVQEVDAILAPPIGLLEFHQTPEELPANQRAFAP